MAPKSNTTGTGPGGDLDPDKALEEEQEMAEAFKQAEAEAAAMDAELVMSLDDWHSLDTPAWDPTKFKVVHLKKFLDALPQACAE